MSNGIASEERTNLYGFVERERDQRRKLPGERKVYDIKQLWQLSHEIINLASLGYKQVDIAEILNVTPQTVSNTLNSTLGQGKISEVRGDRDEEVKKVHEKVRVLTNKALNVYHEIFDDQSGESTLKDKKEVADKVLLDLSGLRAPTKIQSQNLTAILTSEELAEIKKRGIAASREAGLIVDIEPEEITDGNGNGDGKSKILQSE